MAFRKIHDSFWADPEIEDWTTDMRYFYLYCITNPQQTATGVMAFSLKRVAFEVGYDKGVVESLIKLLSERKRIIVDSETKELYVSKFYKYNKSTTKNHIKHLEKSIEKIKSSVIRDQVIADVENEGTELDHVEPKVKKSPSEKKPNIPFEKIWKKYGRGDERYEAEKYWLKMSDESRQEAYDGLDGFLDKKPDPKFRPYLVRYLKKKLYKDDFDEYISPEKEKPKEKSTEDLEVEGLYG